MATEEPVVHTGVLRAAPAGMAAKLAAAAPQGASCLADRAVLKGA